MSDCATEETKGFYFALFWAYYVSSQIVGSFVGALLITRTTGPTFFMIMGSFTLLFSFLFFEVTEGTELLTYKV